MSPSLSWLLTQIQKIASHFPPGNGNPYAFWLTEDQSLGIRHNGSFLVKSPSSSYLLFHKIGFWVTHYAYSSWEYHQIHNRVKIYLLINLQPSAIRVNDIIKCKNIEIRRELLERMIFTRFLTESEINMYSFRSRPRYGSLSDLKRKSGRTFGFFTSSRCQYPPTIPSASTSNDDQLLGSGCVDISTSA